MIRKRLVLVLVAFMVISAFGAETMAQEENAGAGVDFDVSGYYRVRYDNMFQTEWAFDDESDWWTYWNQRMILEPNMIINEKVRINMQFDILSNVTFGNNTQSRVPVVMVDRSSSDVEKIEQVEFGSFTLSNGNIFTQDMSSSDVVLGKEVDPVKIRRLYGEVQLPVGVLRVGRQASNFGLGIFSNAGDGIDDDFGDTYDRILFGTKIGPWVPVFIYDKIVEDDYKVADTDVNQFVLVNYIKDVTWGVNNHFDAGIYVMNRIQQSADAKIFGYDFWFRFGFGGFRIESETAVIRGKMTMFDRDVINELKEKGLPTGEGGGKISAAAYINADQIWYESDQWGVGVEYGFSSPSDPNPEREFDAKSAAQIAIARGINEGDPDSAQAGIDFINSVVENQSAFGTHVYTFPFDRDYSVDLIIWETLMGGYVKNGMYGKIGGYVNPLDLFQIRLDFVKSWINESGKGKDGKDADHDLGFEIDTDFSFTVADHFLFGLQFGYAFPGKYFEDVYHGVEDVFTFQTRFVFEF